ncbi:MAG: iron-containing alcohol dehydrogenase [Acidobacteriota bacterium]
MIGFRLPTHVHIAPGASQHLADVTKSLDARRVLFVFDPGLAATDHPQRMQKDLADAGVHVESFDAIEPNPRTTTAEAAGALAAEHKLEAVIGLGGGSTLDAAKAAAMLATNPGPAASFAGVGKYHSRPLPFIAIPTTCGTGSEVTWVSVLSDPSRRTKVSVKGLGMFPDQALVDADLLRTLPTALVKWTALDALTHALEAYTCNRANPVSDILAERAIVSIWRFIGRAAADIEGDDEARARIMQASTVAGISFGNADVASVHCLSESLGGLYDLPHGKTNAILLYPLLQFNRPYIDARLARLFELIEPDADVKTDVVHRADFFMEELLTLLTGLDVPHFSTLEVPTDDYPMIAAQAAANNSNSSNAKKMTASKYETLLGRLEKPLPEPPDPESWLS